MLRGVFGPLPLDEGPDFIAQGIELRQSFGDGRPVRVRVVWWKARKPDLLVSSAQAERCVEQGQLEALEFPPRVPLGVAGEGLVLGQKQPEHGLSAVRREDLLDVVGCLGRLEHVGLGEAGGYTLDR